MASIASAGASLLEFDALISCGNQAEQALTSLQYSYHWAFSHLIGSGGVAVVLSLSSAVPEKAQMCSGKATSGLDRKILVIMFLTWLAERKTIFTTGKIQKDLELNSGQVTACCWMLICSLCKKFGPNCSGNLQEAIFHFNFSALLAQAEMNPGSTKSLKEKKEQ